ncbi:MAG: hypothetical protein ABSF59_21985 [Candidatus Sulfotelmatobacter sp.]
MGLAVEHTIALLDGGLADGLCQMAFAAPGAVLFGEGENAQDAPTSPCWL